MNIVTSAAVFAAEAHAGQVRKELGEPYIVHPLRVGKTAAQLGMDEEFIAACYLHDVVEDTVTKAETIERLFPRRTYELVRAVTKWWEAGHPSEVITANKTAYYEQILRTDDAALLKVLDRVDNLYDFAKMARRAIPKSHKWADKYLAKTRSEFAPLLQGLSTQNTTASLLALQYYDAAFKALELAL